MSRFLLNLGFTNLSHVLHTDTLKSYPFTQIKHNGNYQMKKLLSLFVLLVFTLTACATNTPVVQEPAAPEPAVQEPAGDQSASYPEPVQGTTESESTGSESTADTVYPEPPAEVTTASVAPAAFQIVSAESEARFTIDEILNGNDKTVIGTTSEVTGEMTFNLGNPADSAVGTITIGTGNFVTDNNFRNRAIRQFVLQSSQYPEITFTPTELAGLPASASVGDVVTFQIVGNLTVREVTGVETFDVTVTVVSETRLEGLATTTISRMNPYNLTIPDVPSVASVDEDMLLELEFVAAP